MPRARVVERYFFSSLVVHGNEGGEGWMDPSIPLPNSRMEVGLPNALASRT